MKCERCRGEIVFKPIIQDGDRKPALKGKRVCEDCDYWPSAHVTHDISRSKPLQPGPGKQGAELSPGV